MAIMLAVGTMLYAGWKRVVEMPARSSGLAPAERFLRYNVIHGVSEELGMEMFFANAEVDLKNCA